MTIVAGSVTSYKSVELHHDFVEPEVSDAAVLVNNDSPCKVRTTVPPVSRGSPTNITFVTVRSEVIAAGKLVVLVLIPTSSNLCAVLQNSPL